MISPCIQSAPHTFLSLLNSAFGMLARKLYSGCAISEKAAARWWFSMGALSL